MEYRQLGNAGVRVSVVGLGTNTYGSEQVPDSLVQRFIDAASEMGINLIDTADQYTDGESEVALGKALKGRWDKFVVASKFYFPMGKGPNDRGTSRYHMLNSLEASLRRLQSDHIDLYYIHRWDETTPIEETLRALNDVVSMGKVRYIGASMFAAWQLAKANLLSQFRGWAPIVALQSRYSMLDRDVEREVLPYCLAENVGFIPYMPLAGGLLTGKYKRGQPIPDGSRGSWHSLMQAMMTDANFDILERLQDWCDARGQTLGTLAQAWLLTRPRVCSVITGATSMEQFLANTRAAEWTPNAEEIAEVDAILSGSKVSS